MVRLIVLGPVLLCGCSLFLDSGQPPDGAEDASPPDAELSCEETCDGFCYRDECLDPSMAAFVAGPTGTSNADCFQSMPCRSLAEGIFAAESRGVSDVVVVGEPVLDEVLAYDSQPNPSIRILGGGATVQPVFASGDQVLTIAQSKLDVFDLVLDASQLTGNFPAVAIGSESEVVFDGVTITGSPDHGIRVDGMSSLTAEGITIQDTQGFGSGIEVDSAILNLAQSTITGNFNGIVATNPVSLVVEGSRVSNNSGSGIRVEEGPFSIRNTLIASNMGEGVAVILSEDIEGKAAFELNTVAGNSSAAVDCGVSTVGLDYSVRGNLLIDNGAGDNCVSSPFEFGIETNLRQATPSEPCTPTFVNAEERNYRQAAESECINLLVLEPVVNPGADRDPDGTVRPQNQLPDLGAFERLDE